MRFESHLRAAKRAVDKGAEKNLKRGLAAWHRSLMRTMAGGRTGREYQVPNTGRTYTASAPGEPPANRTGDTRGSYKWVIDGPFRGRLGSPYKHALWLERGTRYMQPRPHLKESFNRDRANIVRSMGKPFE